MTIDDAIKHAEEVAEENDKHKENMRKRYGEHIAGYKMYCKCAEEYRQLAEWLKELKAYREILTNADKIIASEYGCVIIEGYADLIDQMNELFKDLNADADSD